MVKSNLAYFDAWFDNLVDMDQVGGYEEDVDLEITGNLELLLSRGKHPQQLAEMIYPASVMARLDVLKGINMNRIALRMTEDEKVKFLDVLLDHHVKMSLIRPCIQKLEPIKVLQRVPYLLDNGFTVPELASFVWPFMEEALFDFVKGDSELVHSLLLISCDSDKHACRFLDCAFGTAYDDGVNLDLEDVVEAVSFLANNGRDVSILSHWLANNQALRLEKMEILFQKYEFKFDWTAFTDYCENNIDGHLTSLFSPRFIVSKFKDIDQLFEIVGYEGIELLISKTHNTRVRLWSFIDSLRDCQFDNDYELAYILIFDAQVYDFNEKEWRKAYEGLEDFVVETRDYFMEHSFDDTYYPFIPELLEEAVQYATY